MFTTPKSRVVLLAIVTILVIYCVKRNSVEESFTSVPMTRCRNFSSMDTGASMNGIFYREADIATRDEDWGMKKCELQELTNLTQLYDYIKTPIVRCDTPLMLGGHLFGNQGFLDGEKWACMDKKYRVSPLKCIVFSFGIGGDWSFEDEVEAKLGCKVFAFDHTIKKKTYKRSARISFFSLGISDNTGTDRKGRKVDRYSNILDRLGHLNSTIDILKIDVEGSEKNFFKDMFEKTPNLLKNIKMIAMELHMGNNVKDMTAEHETFWKYFQLLDCFGFKIWHSSVNPSTGGRKVDGQHRSCCYEVVWVQDREW